MTGDSLAPARPTVRRLGGRLSVQPRTLIGGAAVLLLAYLVLGPLVVLLLSTLRETDNQLPFDPAAQWTFGNFAQVFASARTYELLFNTLVVSAGSLAIGFTISTALAWLVERTDLPGRNVIFVLVVASLGVPSFIAGIAWTLLLNPSNGMINVVLRELGIGGPRGPIDIFTLGGLIFVQGIGLVPVTFLLISAAFRTIDASLEEAATTSGASPVTTFRRVTLPLLTPALLSAFVYQFITLIETFDIPLVIGLRADIVLLSTQIYLEMKPSTGLPNYGLASTYGVLLFALAIIPLLYYNRVIGRSERFATISGHSYRARRIPLGRWKFAALAFIGAYLILDLALPILVMLWTSLLPFVAMPSAESLSRVSLRAYETQLANPNVLAALRNTAVVVVLTASATMLIALVVSWIVVRSRSRLRPALDVLAFLPHTFPAVVLGLSLILIYLWLPIPVYATIWIVVVALATRYIGIATRTTNSGIGAIQRQLEEAAEMSGASWLQTMRRVVLPLVTPAFFNGFLLVALLSLKQLVLPLMLVSQGNEMLSTIIWGRWDAGNTSGTAALGMLMVALTLVLAILTRRPAERAGALR